MSVTGIENAGAFYAAREVLPEMVEADLRPSVESF
jgi:hypothetical protein